MSSPSPQRGPEPKNLISLAIFIKLQAITFKAPWSSTMASWAARASNLFGALKKTKWKKTSLLIFIPCHRKYSQSESRKVQCKGSNYKSKKRPHSYLVNGSFVYSAILAAIFSANPILVLSPVPTAVPPIASSYTLPRVPSTLEIPYSICCT